MQQDNVSVEERLASIPAREFKIDLNLQHVNTFFVPYIIGGKTAADDCLSILVHNLEDGRACPYGALRITRKQWAELKQIGDRMFEGHSRTFLPASA